MSILLLGAALTGSVARSEPTFLLPPADHALLDEIQRAAFLFFKEQSHPVTGLVRDRAPADGSPSAGKASIAASGFALSAWVIATDRGWVQRDEAVIQVRHKLRFLAEAAPRRHGFYYHFMEMESGQRAWQCEVSSIDSALLFAGTLVAREYFADKEITDLTNRLLREVDWAWFRNGGGLVSLAWHDESGFSRYRWDHFSEHLLMSFLALGTSDQPVEAEYWQKWTRTPLGRYGDRVYLQEPPLFVHQFPHAYLDLRERRDAFADYFHNSTLATLAQRQFSLDLRAEFPSWGENLWGLTASDSVTGYKAWGGPPRTTHSAALDGTIVPCAAAGSLIFAPAETLAVLRHLREIWSDRIWRRYGFVDAFNPETGWVNEDVIGIDLGITLLQAENLRTGLIHRLFMQSPEARLGLAKAGLLSTSRTLSAADRKQLLELARGLWGALASAPASPGLQLSATAAAMQVGLIEGRPALQALRAILASPSPRDPRLLSHFLIAVAALRQWVPALATDCTARLATAEWDVLSIPSPGQLGAEDRLGCFLQIAAGRRPATEWQTLLRETMVRGQVRVLAPANISGALLPGLWLDETGVLAGASAAQLAYSQLVANPSAAPDALTLAFWLDRFPGETLRRFRGAVGSQLPAGGSDSQATLFMVVVGLLTGETMRKSAQLDPLISAGRTAIPDFAEAAFGPNTSVFAQRELAATPPPAPPRNARALRQDLPRSSWDWHNVAGLEFKDSVADVRDDDPPVSFRFALTWNDQALYLHAEVSDKPAGYLLPAERNRLMELSLDLDGDGFSWQGARDFQFSFIRSHFWHQTPPGTATELFHGMPAKLVVTDTSDGYMVEAAIQWSDLGLTPRAGLELGVSPAALAQGTKDWEPTIKLNWSSHRIESGRSRLGRARLE